MQQSEPDEAPESEEQAIERRFADLMRRFWHRASPPEPAEEGTLQ
jgi:hypothetical protein